MFNVIKKTGKYLLEILMIFKHKLLSTVHILYSIWFLKQFIEIKLQFYDEIFVSVSQSNSNILNIINYTLSYIFSLLLPSLWLNISGTRAFIGCSMLYNFSLFQKLVCSVTELSPYLLQRRRFQKFVVSFILPFILVSTVHCKYSHDI